MKQLKKESQFAICIHNEDCEDLGIGKVYQLLSDEYASKDGYIRLVDESGEDYLYPADYFVPIVLPQSAERVLLSVATA
ncbi:MAG: hypothetical protein ABIF11_11770 [Nitrospirota bacterium]